MKHTGWFSPVVLLAIALLSSSLAKAQNYMPTMDDLKAGAMTAVQVPAAANPLTSATPLVVATVTVGYQTSGVPCVNCVNAGTPNVGIPLPVGVINQGTGVTYTVAIHNVSYTGTMTVAILLKQGSTNISGGTVTISNAQPNTVYIQAFNGTVPSKPGATTVIGAAQPGSGTWVGQGLALFIQ